MSGWLRRTFSFGKGEPFSQTCSRFSLKSFWAKICANCLLTCDQMVTYNGVMEVEDIFKALADHHRRHLLDVLSQADGQTLNQLAEHLPMTRYGTMKHLRILEEAGLVSTRKVGREKRHYLTPAPMRSVAGWVNQYQRYWEESFDRLDELLHELQQKEPKNDHSES